MTNCIFDTQEPKQPLGAYWQILQSKGGTWEIKDWNHTCPGHSHVEVTIGDEKAIGSDLAYAAAKLVDNEPQ